jgi:hypothetical protein
MFYYHNPLNMTGAAQRFPSLELPFSPTQPCKLIFVWVILCLYRGISRLACQNLLLKERIVKIKPKRKI